MLPQSAASRGRLAIVLAGLFLWAAAAPAILGQGFRPPVFTPPPSIPVYTPPPQVYTPPRVYTPPPFQQPNITTTNQVQNLTTQTYQLQQQQRFDQNQRDNQYRENRQQQDRLDSTRLQREQQDRQYQNDRERTRVQNENQRIRDDMQQRRSQPNPGGNPAAPAAPGPVARPVAPLAAGGAAPAVVEAPVVVAPGEKAMIKFRLALRLFRDGHTDKAATWCRRILTDFPRTPAALLARKLLDDCQVQ